MTATDVQTFIMAAAELKAGDRPRLFALSHLTTDTIRAIRARKDRP